MSNLESIVRPFQRPDSLARKRIVASNTKIDVQPAIISWGKSGTITAAHQIDQIDPTGAEFTVITCDDNFTEVGRKVDQIRVEQTLPDGTRNPDNYVDLDRPYQVTMKKESETEPAKNTTQTWSTSISQSGFKTVGFNNKDCQSKYNFKRSL